MKLSCLLFIVVVMVVDFGYCQSQECETFVQDLIENVYYKKNISYIPLPAIMYSGITTNNPGQFYQCEQQANFSYYLVTIKNTTTGVNSFTGLCVPSQCSKQDMKIALDFWNCQVYDFPQNQSDTLAIFGLVILFTWLSLLIIWSIVLSCKQPQINQYVKKEKQQTQTVNSLIDRQSHSTNNNDDNNDGKNGEFMRSKIFNYYQGYCKIFKKQKRRSLVGSFFFLAALSILVTMEFSMKQTIASNPAKAYDFFNSFLGIFVTNSELAFSLVMFILGMKLAYGVYKFVTFHQIGRFFFDQLLKKWTFFIIISLSIYGVMSYTDDPLSKYWNISFAQDCPKYLWQQWFLFRNFQLDGKVCLPWLWIIQADIFLTLLSAPFIIIYRIKKNIGYTLMSLICLISIVIGFAILSDQSVTFEPTKMFNQQKEFSLNYQTNTLVRAGAFYLGLMFGFLVIEGLEKVQGKARTPEYKLAKRVKKSKMIQNFLHIFGIAIMVVILSSIAFYFNNQQKGESKNGSYFFITITPIVFLLGFSAFILPSFWQSESGLSVLINKVFGWSGWNSLQKLAPMMLAIGPAVMGFTTYSSQNNIYFDLQTIFVYLLGDLLMVYVIALLVGAAIDNQIVFIFNFIQTKVFGKQNKYSILLLQE